MILFPLLNCQTEMQLLTTKPSSYMKTRQNQVHVNGGSLHFHDGGKLASTRFERYNLENLVPICTSMLTQY